MELKTSLVQLQVKQLQKHISRNNIYRNFIDSVDKFQSKKKTSYCSGYQRSGLTASSVLQLGLVEYVVALVKSNCKAFS